jgi:Protein of unknown function, DUF481
MLTALLSFALCAVQAQPAQAPTPPAQAARPMVRVFLDCPRCDEDYLKREVTFIDYVRNREDADVHVLVTTQETGGGGVQFTLKFIGIGRFQGQDEALTYNSPQTATADERRAGFAERFRVGLVRYAVDSSIADRLRVTFQKAEEGAKPGQHDPWNYWVFRIGTSGDVNGEELQSGRSIRGSFSANRTTDAWRLSFQGGANYRDSKFLIDEEDGTQTTILSVNRNINVDGTIVKSLTPHWSLGILGHGSSETFRNFALRTRIGGGVEYDIFPYSESTRRLITINYTVGHDHHRYREVTIYDKTSEQLLDHRLEGGVSVRQPWGSISAVSGFSQYLTDPSKYSLNTFGGANIRVFKGFSVSVFGEFSRTRDQIYLPRGQATTEEILLRQRQLATGYQYFVNFGVSYSFGSIFNNIVNPRFGGVNFDF